MSAAEAWRRQLEDWAIPEELLAVVEDSPYSWPVELFRRRNESADESAPTGTQTIVFDLLGDDGTVLDIGCGTGRASLPFAEAGHAVTGVERSGGMLEGLRAEVAARDVSYEVIEGSWPGVDVGTFDVVMCANVVYDVQDIVPFIEAMADHASRAVVIEMTERHPWWSMAPYYRTLHDLDRPGGPTVDDLATVVAETTGREPEVERWERPGGMWFESWDEIETLFARRLVLPAERRGELRALMEPDLVRDGEKIWVGAPVRRMASVWWRV